MSVEPKDGTSSAWAGNQSIEEPPIYELAHSTVALEEGPAGTIGRVTRGDGTREWVGPLPPETIAALEAVATEVNYE